MPMSTWEEVAGHNCEVCGGYATHLYGNIYICCDCHGGEAISQEEAKAAHEREARHAVEAAPACPACGREMEPDAALVEWGGPYDIAPRQEEVPIWHCPACDYTEEMED